MQRCERGIGRTRLQGLSSSADRLLHFLVYPFSPTKQCDLGQLHDRPAQDLVLRNFRPATRWRAVREAVILCG
jgi:hypothetical protein